MRRTIALALSALALVAAVWSGLVTADGRYVHAQEYRKDNAHIQRSLTNIQVRQLQNETREIERQSKGQLSENDRNRLAAIAEEVRELKEAEIAAKKP